MNLNPCCRSQLSTDLIGDPLGIVLEHLLKVRREQVHQISLSVEFEAERHDLTGEAIASEQCLHAVALHLPGEHVA